jgi:DNA-binding MarR family transcriptional regulator
MGRSEAEHGLDGRGRSAHSVDSPWNLGEVLEFMRLLWAVDHALQKRSKQMQGVLGVTGPQRLVIRILGRFPGIPAGRLSEILHMHPSTLTGILKRLERGGRRSDPRDRRRSLLGLTPKGKSLDARTAGTVEAAVREVFLSLPKRKLEVTGEILAALAAALQPEEIDGSS